MDADERVRRQAVRRVLGGERAVEVARALGRSERWIFKWLSRYDPSDEGWAVERSRAPQHVPSRSEPKLEALVLQVRARLAAQPWPQIGAPAIAWELEKLHLRRIPELRTIERILRTRRHAAAPASGPLRRQGHALSRRGATRAERAPGGGPGRPAPSRRRDPLLRLQRRRSRPARGGLRAAAQQNRCRDGRLARPDLGPSRHPRAAQARQLAGRDAASLAAPGGLAVPGAG